MKKTLVTLLALVFVLGIAATAFAAPANPFVDVPAKHWAYGAVSKLAKAGIVDGYGDGTFRGDRTMTRYEMAQIVAKAMAKSEKADAEMKALIDKLAVEFAAELNNLGVRVAKLEAKTNVGLTYESRLRWGGDDNEASDKQGTRAFDLRQRIYLSGVVNDKIDYGARIQTGAMRYGENNDNTITLNRMFFNIKGFAGLDKITLGKQPVYVGLGLLTGATDGREGIRIDTALGDTTTFTGLVVDVGNGPQSELAMANFTFKPNKDVIFNLGYETANLTNAAWPAGSFPAFLSHDNKAVPYAFSGQHRAFDVGAAAKLGDFWIKGEYVAAKLEDMGCLLDHVLNKSPKAYSFEISNSVGPNFSATSNQVDPMKAHTDAFAIGYRSIEQGALASTLSAYNGQLSFMTGYNGLPAGNSIWGMTQDNNVKGFFFQYQNVLSKGLVFSFDYADLKQKNVYIPCAPVEKDKLWMGRLEFYF